MGFPRGHSLLWAPTCSSVGSSPGCRWRSAPLWTSLGCRGTACLTMVFPTGCRGTYATAPGSSPPPPSSLTLGVCRVVSLTWSHSSLWLPFLSVPATFFSFLNMLSQRCYPIADWLGLGRQRVRLRAGWYWLCWT